MALSKEKQMLIQEMLHRSPNLLEQSCFELMWSDEMSHINALTWLKHSNVDCYRGDNLSDSEIENGIHCVLQIESNRQYCSIDPYHGAAGGIGLSLRALYACGARPVALLTGMHLGALQNNNEVQQLTKIADGIADYVNRIGTPGLKGLTFFHEYYSDNPLVNFMSVGLKNVDEMPESPVSGDVMLLLGETASHLDEQTIMRKSSPYRENVLQHFVLNLYKKKSLKRGIPLGEGGLLAALARAGMELQKGVCLELGQLAALPDTETIFHLLSDDKSEQVLLIVSPQQVEEVRLLADYYDLKMQVAGHVADGNTLEVRQGKKSLLSVPAEVFFNPPLWMQAPQSEGLQYSKSTIHDGERPTIPEPDHCKKAAFDLVVNPNIVSKKWIYEQWDDSVGASHISRNFPASASLINIQHTNKALAVTLSTNAWYVSADPNRGTQIAVAEAARNIACTGAVPKMMANCLNAGNPNHPDTYRRFVQMVKGLNYAARMLRIPIVNDNVNFNPEAKGLAEATPLIGMAGLLDDKNYLMTKGFKAKGDMIFLLGESVEDIASSEYLMSQHKVSYSDVPAFDLEQEILVQHAVQELIRSSLVRSAHSVSRGGLWIALLECAMVREFGFDITSLAEIRRDAFLFGEAQGRVVVSVTADKEFDFIDFMKSNRYPYIALGHVTREELRIDDVSFGFISDVKELFDTHFETRMQQ